MPPQPDPFAAPSVTPALGAYTAPPVFMPASTTATQPPSSLADSTLQQASFSKAQGPTTAPQPSITAPQVVTTAPDGRRKKKSSRRVGYARDEAAEAPARPASPALPAATTAPAAAVTSSASFAPSHASAAPHTVATPQASTLGTPAAPLAATHTTAALLELVSASAPVQPSQPELPSPTPTPVATAGHSQASQNSKHASTRHPLPQSDASPRRAAATAAAAQARGALSAPANSSIPLAAATQPLSALTELLPIHVPAVSAQDIRHAEVAAAMSSKAFMQVGPQPLHSLFGASPRVSCILLGDVFHGLCGTQCVNHLHCDFAPTSSRNAV